MTLNYYQSSEITSAASYLMMQQMWGHKSYKTYAEFVDEVISLVQIGWDGVDMDEVKNLISLTMETYRRAFGEGREFERIM